MKLVAFDLRCIPRDGSPGAGMAHATRELWEACVPLASQHGLEMVPWLPALSACHAFFAPTGHVPWGMRVPIFPWVHDLAIFSHPEWFPESWLRRQYTTRKFLHGLDRARHIFCVSQDTEQALRACLPSLARATVTYEGVEYPDVCFSWSTRLDQALVLGTVEPRKNIAFLLELWPEVVRRLGRSVRLTIAGKAGWGNVAVTKSDFIERHEHVSDETRERLLQQARLVLVPSWYEGFGRVALEAMAYGAPVIASDAGAHPEVVAEAGILLAPDDRAGWINAIVELLTNKATWTMRQNQGRERARLFAWQRVAKSILAKIADSL